MKGMDTHLRTTANGKQESQPDLIGPEAALHAGYEVTSRHGVRCRSSMGQQALLHRAWQGTRQCSQERYL